jgi:hypothetical protein
MKKNYVRGLVVGTAVAAMACVGGGAYAVTTAAGFSAVNVTGPDHQRLVFTLAPGGSQRFKLPAANDPVRIDLDKISTNGGVQTPSEVFSALVNVDRNGAGMSWIGTSSDGSQAANSTIHSSTITQLVCGANCVIATLSVSNVGARSVVLTANAATSIINETYVVNIWY